LGQKWAGEVASRADWGPAARKGHGSLVARKGVAEEREGHLAAEGETGCDLYHLCVEMATAQNPPHLPIFRDFWGSGCLASA